MKTDVYDSINFLKTGFKDYISARVLFREHLYYNGAILACTAIEKYLKAVLSISGEINTIHLDNLEKIKRLFQKTSIDIVDKLDSKFLELLGNIYRFRYYDNVTKNTDGFGFLTKQFLGELDFTIYRIEKSLTLKGDRTSKVIKTDYDKALESANKLLLENNYIHSGINKKEFMESPSPLYILVINDKQQLVEEPYTKQLVTSPYKGHINLINNLRFKKVDR